MANPLFQTITLGAEEIGDLAKVSSAVRQNWNVVREGRRKAVQYYSGDIFNKRIDDTTSDDGGPLLYPVGINLVKMLVLAMTDAIFGEWDDERNIIFFEPRSGEAVPDPETANYCAQVLEDSSFASMGWELEFDRNLYGACVLKVSPSFKNQSHVKWTKIPIDGFYPIFDPEDPNTLLEVYYISQITPEQARTKYGFSGDADKEYITRVEHWTSSVYEILIDGNRVDRYSGVNPWGVVPFVYIPRMRTVDWWGEAMVEDIYAPQDELNMRLADTGDALNYHSHPIFFGRDLPNTFNSNNYPVAANAFWDLGRTRGAQGAEAEVGLLESKQPVSPAVFDYIKFLLDWTKTSSSAPPIAFGEDDGGGQRSGVTLQIRLWPLLKATRRSRSYLSAGLKQALYITGKILQQKGFGNVSKETIKNLVTGGMSIKYNHILPHDQPAIVDEVVKLLSTKPPMISMETAQTKLGHGTPEVARIEAMLEKYADLINPPPPPVAGITAKGGTPAKPKKDTVNKLEKNAT